MMSKLLREPLLWFLLVGAVLFWLDGRRQAAAQRIEVTAAIISRLQDQWQAQLGRPATATELEGLVADWIEEEIYSREAEAMGLGTNDTIIRRRLVQKLRFLTEDLALAGEPPQAELDAYYNEHAERYREPERYDFEHRFFSTDRRADAIGDARAALPGILNGETSDTVVGDPFLLQREFFNRSERQIGDLFGRGFAAALAAAPEAPPQREEAGWFGPIASAYGQHLVRIKRHLPAFKPPLEDVRQRVLADLKQAKREAANQAFYERLKARYQIVRDAPG